MGLFSKIKKSVSSAVNKAKSSVKSAVSKASSKIDSAVKIGGTNIKNLFSVDTIAGAVKGYQEGGLYGAIGGAAMSTVSKSMTELDKSGKFNSEYEYKQYGFPSKEEYLLASSYGYDNYDDWKTVKELLGSDVTTETAVTPVESSSSTSVDSSGNIVVNSPNTVDATSTDKSGGVGAVALGALALKVMGVF